MLALALGVAALAVASQVAVPMVPVPITLQTLAVTLIGALMGWRWGAATVLVWLALGAAGAPVFSDFSGGIGRLTGPTGGYLIAFPVAAALTGCLAERGWDGRRPGPAFAAMLLATALCLAVGGGWLATQVGAETAWSKGVQPFLFGAVIKSAVGAAVLWAAVFGAARRRPA